MTTTSLAPSSAFLDLMIYGVQPPSPNYYTRLMERQREDGRRIELLTRMKAVITLCDVIDILEAA